MSYEKKSNRNIYKKVNNEIDWNYNVSMYVKSISWQKLIVLALAWNIFNPWLSEIKRKRNLIIFN